MKYEMNGYIFRNGKDVDGLDEEIEIFREFAEKQIDGLIFSKEKPLRDDEGYEEWMDHYDNSIELPKHWFPEVKWEDEPQKVKLSIEKE